MIHANHRVTLDACVLATHSVCDLLLRLAERPILVTPHWSEEILNETYRTHEKLGWPSEIRDSFQAALREHFPSAIGAPGQALIDICVNHPKDRHVLATAIVTKSETIVTYNLRDFPMEALKPWGVSAVHPSDYLLDLLSINPTLVLQRMAEIQSKSGISSEQYYRGLNAHLPGFAQTVAGNLGIDI